MVGAFSKSFPWGVLFPLVPDYWRSEGTAEELLAAPFRPAAAGVVGRQAGRAARGRGLPPSVTQRCLALGPG